MILLVGKLAPYLSTCSYPSALLTQSKGASSQADRLIVEMSCLSKAEIHNHTTDP